MIRHPPKSPLFPYTTLSRSNPPNTPPPKRKHGGETAENRVRTRHHTADRVVCGSWQGILPPGRQVADPRARSGIKKDAIGADELERVPFDGIVAGGEDDAAGGPMMLYGELYRRRCN